VVSKIRTIRIAERIRDDLAELLIRRVHDPRLVGITITGVEVDRELAYATVFISSLEGSARSSEILAGLEHAKGFLRSELAHQINLRHFPRLRFRWDPTPEHAEVIERLLSSLPKDESGMQDLEISADQEKPESSDDE
jgi:ribosome-binding factor A